VDAAELFWSVTFPIILTFAITVLVSLISGRRKLDEISFKLDNISKDLSDLKRDFSGMISRVIDQLVEIIKHPPLGTKSNPLPPDKIKRRDFLLEKGRREGLTKEEADELRELLREQAVEAGLTGLALLVFLAMVAFILGFFLSREGGEGGKKGDYHG
jgi:hypothetical protein